MNNLQYIIENDTRAAMHMAVELCEQGDFDSVTEAFGWLMQERNDAALGGGTLTAERDKLKELNGYHAVQYELASEDCDRLQAQVDELIAERDKLQELNEYHALQYELASEDADRLQAQVDELTAERDELQEQVGGLTEGLDGWKKQALANGNACYEARQERDNLAADLLKANNERERYRSKFGKCLDYADAIHALMDEGMA